MKWKYSFDALIADYPADREGFVYAASFAGDYGAGEDLNSLFITLFDTAMDVYCITYFKMRYIFL